ncbi:MAG: hypothetical protein ACRD3E_02590, partial [Terriglobales bacterium]
YQAYGYAFAETTHDCGEIGGLAQSRKRFLMVARHTGKVAPFLYEPPKRPLRAVGDILGRMPLPGDSAGGPMHAVPNLQWKTWVRLALVEAGSDWRSLNKLRVLDGKLADYLIVPAHCRNDFLGVTAWDEASGTVTADARPHKGSFAVADPRCLTGFTGKGNYLIVPYDQPANTVIAQSTTGHGAFGVADPRPPAGPMFSKYMVTPWDKNAGTVISSDDQGAYAVADPRPGFQRAKGDDYLTAGHYGVVPWTEPCGAVSAAAGHDSGRFNVADPRLPEGAQKLLAVIRALDGTWHRPFTTLELAALQSLVDPDEMFDLDGNSDSAKRERIGNAVPPQAARAIADVMGQTLLLAWSGESFQLSAQPIWVRPIAVALSVRTFRG